jgi:hypothetical protein
LMSLPARQQRVLGRIEHSLHADDPRLRSMFAIFTKLTRGQQMPRLELLESRSWPRRYWRQRLTRRRREGRAASGAGSTHAPGVRMRAILLVPVMLAALAAAVFLGLGGRTVSGCGPAARPQHSASELGRPRACLPVRQPLAYQRVPGG